MRRASTSPSSLRCRCGGLGRRHSSVQGTGGQHRQRRGHCQGRRHIKASSGTERPSGITAVTARAPGNGAVDFAALRSSAARSRRAFLARAMAILFSPLPTLLPMPVLGLLSILETIPVLGPVSILLLLLLLLSIPSIPIPILVTICLPFSFPILVPVFVSILISITFSLVVFVFSSILVSIPFSVLFAILISVFFLVLLVPIMILVSSAATISLFALFLCTSSTD
mmetsp:Transcript_15223/g.27092  ORF Transcript_15223/g.27092 Transcript_15223/m.27092 type:complete len:226 (-) Transcript_15223:162-839(-)